MIADGLIGALGDGWLGKLIVGAVCAAGAWFARRPADKALMMGQVDARFEKLWNESDRARASALAQAERALARCDAVEALHIEERERCDRQLAEYRAEMDQLRAEIDRLMSRPVAGYPTITIQPKGRKS